MACERPDDRGRSLSTWFCEDLARQLAADGVVDSISTSTVQRILASHRLKPWRVHMWLSPKAPRDAEFYARVREVIDLYTRPLREDEVVLSVDEKTSLQPRPRAHATKPARPGGKPNKVEHEYKRCGALQLFAAFDTRTGKVYGKTDDDSMTVTIVEIGKKCKEKVSSTVVEVEKSFKSPTALFKKVSTAIEAAPFVKRCKITIKGSLKGEKGEMCCDEDSYTEDPVEYFKGSGKVACAATVTFKPWGVHKRFRLSGNTPIKYAFGGLVDIGPDFNIAPKIAIDGSVELSECGTCWESRLGATLGLGAGVKAQAQCNLRLFEDGHWYSVHEQLEAEISGGIESGFSIKGWGYATGDACKKEGLTAGKVVLKEGVLNGTIMVSYKGWSLGGSKSLGIWEEITLYP